jgi:hypothetical protein
MGSFPWVFVAPGEFFMVNDGDLSPFTMVNMVNDYRSNNIL